MNFTQSNWIVAFVAAFVTVILLAVMLRRAHAFPIDRPNERSLHDRPVPRIGGLALFPGIVTACLFSDVRDLGLLLALAGVLFSVSIVDDWRGLPAGLRFGAHFAVATAFSLWVVGATPVALVGALAVTWMTNLYNFMDGANGLAGGMAVIGFTVLGIASDNVVLAWPVVGAALGFLCFNFDPARVFLGDAGSIPLGFLAGAICVSGVAAGYWPWWFPFLVFAPFVIDATVTLVRRMVRRERFWTAHRQHYYQRLVRLGWTHRRLAFTEYALMLASGMTALLLLRAPVIVQGAGVAVCLAVYATLMMWVDRRWREAGNAA